MGLFDIFKKRPVNIEQQSEAPVVNKNWCVLYALETRLVEMGYDVKRHTQYLALIIDDELEISFMVVENPNNHPSVMHLMVSLSHAKYFASGILENLVGIGETLEEQVNSALNNYINSTFVTIIDGFSDSHDPGLDFMAMSNGREVLWHPKLGSLLTQGQWDEYPPNEVFFNLLKDKIPAQLTTNKMNWLKIYVSKQANGEVMGECLFNNMMWEAGADEVFNYVKALEIPGEFQGLKQFIMFRRCDVYDEVNG